MKRVIVYVEGRSDKAALETLLHTLIQRKQSEGVSIEFFETMDGDRKHSLVVKAPMRAVRILQNDPLAQVVLMPDLYPKNKGCPHETVEALRAGITENFQLALRRASLTDETRMLERFHVFCFKYDLEALILAAETALALLLTEDTLIPADWEQRWKRPVEDQNHTRPPKQVVMALFEDYQQRYIESRDAQLILALAEYPEIVERCPQCFKPFVEFLERQ